MVDFSKKEAIAVLESFDYKYLGFLDAGWGEKFYHFKSPESGDITITYKLGEMRRRAYLLDMQRWMGKQAADERVAK